MTSLWERALAAVPPGGLAAVVEGSAGCNGPDGPPGFRLGGLYQSESLSGEDSWYYLRFEVDGSLRSVCSTGGPTQVVAWISESGYHGTYQIAGSSIRFKVGVEPSHVEYEGDIEPTDHLRLTSISHINGYRDRRRYRFVHEVAHLPAIPSGSWQTDWTEFVSKYNFLIARPIWDIRQLYGKDVLWEGRIKSIAADKSEIEMEMGGPPFKDPYGKPADLLWVVFKPHPAQRATWSAATAGQRIRFRTRLSERYRAYGELNEMEGGLFKSLIRVGATGAELLDFLPD